MGEEHCRERTSVSNGLELMDTQHRQENNSQETQQRAKGCQVPHGARSRTKAGQRERQKGTRSGKAGVTAPGEALPSAGGVGGSHGMVKSEQASRRR